MDVAIRVFLADGHVAVRDALGAHIATAPDMELIGDIGDGGEILETIQHLQSDVIILDPVIFGKDDRAQIIPLLKGLTQARLLILTDDIKNRETTAAIRAGVKGCLPKGAPAPEILQTIRALHRGESIYHPAAMNDVL